MRGFHNRPSVRSRGKDRTRPSGETANTILTVLRAAPHVAPDLPGTLSDPRADAATFRLNFK